VSRVTIADITTLSTNTWHHVAATLVASTRALTIYIDGVQVATSTVDAFSSAGNTGVIDIGHNPTDGNFWRGKIDDVRIWNVARTGAQISANFRTELTGNPSGLVGYWRFNEGSGSTAADTGGASAQDATLFSGASWSTTDVPNGPPVP